MANRNLRAWIGHGAYKLIRGAAKIPHLNAATQEGIYIDRLDRELGVQNYTADTADVVLETIYYCQTELSSVGETLSKSRIRLNPDFDRNEEKKRLINHDFLILKIQSRPRHSWHAWQPPIYIVAEKVGRNEEDEAGIHITKLETDPANIDTKCALLSIDCHGTCFGSLLNLVGILKSCSPNYNVKHNNCWDYAVSTTKLLLNECIRISRERGRAEEERKMLHALNHLESEIVKKHGWNQGKRALNFAVTKVRGAWK